MLCLGNGLQRKSPKKRGGASSDKQKLRRKVPKKRVLKSKKGKQMILERYLLDEGQRINELLLSMGSMLKATRDLIQNNDVILIQSIQALKEQNETLSKELKELKIHSSENQTIE